MKGHTDRATVNARRPLTPGSRELLEQVVSAFLMQSELSNGEKNQMRGLADRGLVNQTTGPHLGWKATAAGHAVIQAQRQLKRGTKPVSGPSTVKWGHTIPTVVSAPLTGAEIAALRIEALMDTPA